MKYDNRTRVGREQVFRDYVRSDKMKEDADLMRKHSEELYNEVASFMYAELQSGQAVVVEDKVIARVMGGLCILDLIDLSK
jgi:hypothetical protein